MSKDRSKVPTPPDPIDRDRALPWEAPKPAYEDAEAQTRLRAIMEHPSYLEADRDVGFLHEDATRGVRLQLEYLKADETLSQQEIGSCVVIFGSTRLREPKTARRELEAARQLAEKHSGEAQYQRALRSAERRMELSRYYEIGRELGYLVGASSDRELVVMTGGGPGGMEAANRGAYEAGGKSVGLNITLPREQYPNPYITPGLCLQFHYFALRKFHFMKRAVALVTLPGGYGTLDELFGALTLIQTRKVAPMPVVLIGESYWRRVFDVDFLVECGSIDEEDRELFWFAETAEEAWDGILEWHQANGSPLLANGNQAEDE